MDPVDRRIPLRLKYFAVAAPTSGPSSGDISNIIDRLQTAQELSNVAADSELVKAASGLRELSAARLTPQEVEALRGMEAFRMHPSVSQAALTDFAAALRALLG